MLDHKTSYYVLITKTDEQWVDTNNDTQLDWKENTTLHEYVLDFLFLEFTSHDLVYTSKRGEWGSLEETRVCVCGGGGCLERPWDIHLGRSGLSRSTPLSRLSKVQQTLSMLLSPVFHMYNRLSPCCPLPVYHMYNRLSPICRPTCLSDVQQYASKLFVPILLPSGSSDAQQHTAISKVIIENRRLTPGIHQRERKLTLN